MDGKARGVFFFSLYSSFQFSGLLAGVVLNDNDGERARRPSKSDGMEAEHGGVQQTKHSAVGEER